MRAMLTLALLMVSGARADEAWPTFGNPYKFTEQGGEPIYRAVCAGCHMPDGRGASGAGRYPSLADDFRLAASSYPIDVVLKGRKAMPPFGYALSNGQVAAVVSYIRTRFGNDFTDAPTDVDVAAVR